MNKEDKTTFSMREISFMLAFFGAFILPIFDKYEAFFSVDFYDRIVEQPDQFFWFVLCAFVFLSIYFIAFICSCLISGIECLLRRFWLLYKLRKPILIYSGDSVQK